MPLTYDEIALDVPDLVVLGLQVKANVDKLTAIPKADRKATDFALCLGADPNGVQMKIAALIDKVDAQSKT